MTAISRFTKLPFCTTSPAVPSPPNCTSTSPTLGTVTPAPPVIVKVLLAAVYANSRLSVVKVNPPTTTLLVTAMSRLTKLPFCTTSPAVPSPPNCTSTLPTLGTATPAPPVIVNVWSVAV